MSFTNNSNASQRYGFMSRLSGMILPRAKPFKEMGSSGTPVFGGFIQNRERSSKWQGSERYRLASEIVVNTSIVAASVHYFLNLLAHPQWNVSPANETDEAKRLADLTAKLLFNDLLSPWSAVIRRCGMYRFHGFGILEWTAIRRKDGTTGFLDIESRPQHTIERWEVDGNGAVTGVYQRNPQTSELLGLPRGKIVYLVEDTLTDSPEGLGIFRHLLDPYERLRSYLKLESRGFERDLRGTPIGRAPLSLLEKAVQEQRLSPDERDRLLADMDAFIRMQVKSEDTGMLLDSQPYESMAADGAKVASAMQWGMELLTGSAAGLMELNTAIDRIQREMARIIGTEHLMMGDTGGNRALAVDKSRNLYLIANSVLGYIRSVLNRDTIDPLWTLNGWDEDLKPTLEVEDVAFKDVSQVTAALRDMATAGAVLAPDDPAINDVRDLLGIERADLEKAAEAAEALKPPEINTGDNLPPAREDDLPKEDREPATTEDAEKMVAALLKAFNPNQPRDDHGKWTSGASILSAIGVDPTDHTVQGQLKSLGSTWAHFLKVDRPKKAIAESVGGFLFRHAIGIAHSEFVTKNIVKLLTPTIALACTACGVSGIPATAVSIIAGYAIKQVVKKAGLTPERSQKLLIAAGKTVAREARVFWANEMGKADDPPYLAFIRGIDRFVEGLESVDLDDLPPDLNDVDVGSDIQRNLERSLSDIPSSYPRRGFA